jgi:hypothetical protein
MKKLVLALAAVAMIATPALADYSFYGSARVATFYADDSGVSQTLSGATAGTLVEADQQSFNVRLQGNSRFGLKATTGDVSGRIEYGTGVNLRLLYGEVKLGAGTLLIGQTYTPYTKFSNQVLNDDLGNIGYGALYDGRQPMIKYTTDMGLYFAAIQNNASTGGVTNAYLTELNGVATTITVDKVIIPKLVVGFANKAGAFSYNAGVAYQSNDFNVAEGALPVSKESIDSYLLYLTGDAKFGDVAFLYSLHYGTNLSNFGISGRNSSYLGKDATSYGLMLEADMAGFAVGFGYVNDEMEADGFGKLDANDQYTVFVNYTAQIAKGFKIVPEFTYFDYMDNVRLLDGVGTDTGLFGDKYDGGTGWGVGAKLQMDF